MAKKKVKQHGKSRMVPRVPLPNKVLDRLDDARRLVRQRRWEEAEVVLCELHRERPRSPEIMVDLLNLYLETGDWMAHARIGERLVAVDPRREYWTGLAGAFLHLQFPAHARRAFGELLSRWPQHAEADKWREAVHVTSSMMADGFSKLYRPAEKEPWELYILHERVQMELARGRYEQAIELANRILREVPDFLPALNNLSMAEFQAGRSAQAVAAAARALELERENLFALGNWIRFAFCRGMFAEAAAGATHLVTLPWNRDDAPLKLVESLSFIGDDQGILEIAERVTNAAVADTQEELYWHFVATAHARLGNREQAQRLWQRAQHLAPHLDIIRENLADLRRAEDERHGAWGHSLEAYIPRAVHEALVAELERISHSRRKQVSAAAVAQSFLSAHPELVSLGSKLFALSDPRAAGWYVNLARFARHPVLLDAVQVFALGQRGTFAARAEALQMLVETEYLDSGEYRLWRAGEWQDLLMMGYEISKEPLGCLTGDAKKLYQEASLAEQNGQYDLAEKLLNRAIAIAPDEPALLNNLAGVYARTNRREQAYAMIDQLLKSHPDYLFARTNTAMRYARESRFDEARELLKPVLRRKKMHATELASLCMAEIEIALAEKNRRQARQWLSMWREAMPEHRLFASYAAQVDPSLGRSTPWGESIHWKNDPRDIGNMLDI